MGEVCRVLMLGRLAVVQGDRAIARFRTRKTAALLAYLSYFRSRPHPREQLIDLLWPDFDPTAARRSLSVALSSLRQELEPAGVPVGTVLVADRFTVQLSPEAVSTDVGDFHARLRAARQAKSRSGRIAYLKEAVELYAGELLPGFYEDWITHEQVILAERFVLALCALAHLLEAAGDREAAVSCAERAAAVDPLREEPRRELMRLYAALGEPHAAYAQYRDLVRQMRDEFDELPSAPTRALARDLQRFCSKTFRRRSSAASPDALRIGASKIDLSHSVPPRRTVTLLLAEEADAASAVSHNEILAVLRRELRRHGGHELGSEPCTLSVIFACGGDALACAVACQRALISLFPTSAHSPARIAIHTEDMNGSGEDALDPLFERANLILAAAHSGQILCSEATMAIARHHLHSGLQFCDLGPYRLGDLGGSKAGERLFQVDYPGMPAEGFPALAAEPTFMSQLPAPLTRFFDREEELARLVELLNPAGIVRLVTLLGSPGCGKTRLALEAALRLAETFLGCVWFVPLADLRDTERIGSEILKALRIEHCSGESPPEEVAKYLAGRPALLLLDSFEHLVAGAAVAKTLLELIPELRLLVTSQRHIELEGEHEFNLMPLPLPDRYATPEALAQVPSVQLLVDRAQAVLPDFQLTADNAAAVSELCRKLEGIPLAIELAATRMQSHSPVRLVEQLDQWLEILVSRRRDVEPRHRTLRAALEWSYGLLRPELQRFLSRLTTFRGGWTAAAAAGVCEEPLAAEYLQELWECSLVLVEPCTTTAFPTAGGAVPRAATLRYRMLEMTRTFAAERLAEMGVESVVHRRHVDFFLALVEKGAAELKGPQRDEWFAALEAEHDNILHAIGCCQELGPTDDSGLRLCTALRDFWIGRGYWNEGLRNLEEILAATVPTESPTRAAALQAAGSLALAVQDCHRAKGFFEEALVNAEARGDQRDTAASLRGLAKAERSNGAAADARPLLQRSLSLCRELRARRLEAQNLAELALIAADEGDVAEAQKLLFSALDIYRERRDEKGTADLLHNLSLLSRNEGDQERARQLAEEALALNRMLANRRGEAINLSLLGSLARAAGDYEQALARYEAAAVIQEGLGDAIEEAYTLQEVAALECARGNRERAEARMTESLTALRRSGLRNCAAAALEAAGRLCIVTCRFDPTRERVCHCLRFMRELTATPGGMLARASLSECSTATDDATGHPANRDAEATSAARLVGATLVVAQAGGIRLPPYARQYLARSISTLRAALGSATFRAAANEGRARARAETAAHHLESHAVA